MFVQTVRIRFFLHHKVIIFRPYNAPLCYIMKQHFIPPRSPFRNPVIHRNHFIHRFTLQVMSNWVTSYVQLFMTDEDQTRNAKRNSRKENTQSSIKGELKESYHPGNIVTRSIGSKTKIPNIVSTKSFGSSSGETSKSYR